MSKHNFFQVYKNLNNKNKLKSKLKYIVILGVVGIFILGTIGVAAGFYGYKMISSNAANLDLKSITETPLEDQVAKLPINAKGCFEQIQSLANLDTLMSTSIENHFKSIHSACINTNSTKETKL